MPASSPRSLLQVTPFPAMFAFVRVKERARGNVDRLRQAPRRSGGLHGLIATRAVEVDVLADRADTRTGYIYPTCETAKRPGCQARDAA